MRSEIVLIVAALGLMPLAGRAQEAGGAVGCPSIENDHDRLACYDHAMRGAPRAAAPAQAVPAAPASTAAPTTAASTNSVAGTPPTTSGTVAAAPAAAAVT